MENTDLCPLSETDRWAWLIMETILRGWRLAGRMVPELQPHKLFEEKGVRCLWL